MIIQDMKGNGTSSRLIMSNITRGANGGASDTSKHQTPSRMDKLGKKKGGGERIGREKTACISCILFRCQLHARKPFNAVHRLHLRHTCINVMHGVNGSNTVVVHVAML